MPSEAPGANLHSIDFHAHHSPQGAYATFTCGRFGVGGGPTIEGVQPGSMDLVIGYADGDTQDMHALPFFRGAGIADYSDFATDAATPPRNRRLLLEDLTRSYRRSVDRWTAGDFSFEIYTPVRALPDPDALGEAALGPALLPAVAARLTLTNSSSVPRRLLFAITVGRQCRVLSDVPGAKAVAWGTDLGIAARDVPGLEAWVAFSELEYLSSNRSHLLGKTCGFALEVAPGQTRSLELSFGFCRTGVVTSGLECRYFYTRFYPNLVSVLSAGIVEHASLRAAAEAQATELEQRISDEHQRFLLAHSERSYWGNTQLLEHAGRPLWVVLEGEYAMINTLDLSVDMVFYEARNQPWTLRNVLDQFALRHSYVDRLNRPASGARGMELGHVRDPELVKDLILPAVESDLPGGLSFTHDMGVAGQFAPAGSSSYEIAGVIGCFSFMTAEQLVNWILIAATYVFVSGDEAWLTQKLPLLQACLSSLQNRDDPQPARRNGLISLDSARCAGTFEITTYDSLDSSLGQARNSLYLASKTWAAWHALRLMFERARLSEPAQAAAVAASQLEQTVVDWFDPTLGYLPARRHGSSAAIISAVEGLVFPLFWGQQALLDPAGPQRAFLARLHGHLLKVLVPGLCLFADGGWRLSSTSENSWPSKIFICQHVAERVFGIRPHERSHAVHASWQQLGCADWAMTDQCVAGVGKGSKYYPRGVTCFLWLEARAFEGAQS
ncbi:MAG TPA: glycoside hydrolase family 52 protein, partial [Polyangiaceae bacterium]|nr:glycoside hydrolase family 52 protein [Polyangiaceae bacterium]